MYWSFPQFPLLAMHGLRDYWVPMREHDLKLVDWGPVAISMSVSPDLLEV